MPDSLDQLLANINLPTAIAAAALVLVVIVVIRIGKVLIMAGVFGMLAGGVSLGQGHPPATASAHAAIGFGVAAITLFIIRMTKSLMLWVVITALGIGALIWSGVAR
jgi:hypothetical protein